jgi:hypothetical protein
MRHLTLAALALTAALPAAASAQVFRLTGGASSGLQAQGAGLEVHAPRYEAWTGAGIADGRLIFGAFIKTRLHGYTFKAGDDDVPLTLPTDIFGVRTTLHTLGLSVDKQFGRTAVHAFAGQMGTAYVTPMFRAGRSAGPITALLFTDTALTPQLHLFSRHIFTASPTSLSGFDWKPLPSLAFSIAAGYGAGHPYSSESLTLTREHLDLSLAYVRAEDGFQRSLAGTPLESEPDGLNLTGVLRPTHLTNLSFGHQNFLIPASGSQPIARATVDRLSASWKINENNAPSLGSAFFRSTLLDRTSEGASLWITQHAGPIDLRLNYLLSASQSAPAYQAISLTSQEKLTSRISALQVTTYSAGRTSVAFGGSLLTNRIRIGANYQTLYVPFRPDRPFTQALALNLTLHLGGNIQLTSATSFTPEGKMIYSLAGSGSFYRLAGLEAAPQFQNMRLSQYIISGQVTTPDGTPIYGAAIRVGKEVLYTSRDGHFFARQRKPGRYPIAIVPNEFIATGVYTLVSAPADAAATRNQDDPGILIILNRN